MSTFSRQFDTLKEIRCVPAWCGAQEWRWSSVWERLVSIDRALIAAWPVPIPPDWLSVLNEDQDELQVKAVRQAVSLTTPIGDDEWRRVTGTTFNLRRTFRSQGRPCKN